MDVNRPQEKVYNLEDNRTYSTNILLKVNFLVGNARGEETNGVGHKPPAIVSTGSGSFN